MTEIAAGRKVSRFVPSAGSIAMTSGPSRPSTTKTRVVRWGSR